MILLHVVYVKIDKVRTTTDTPGNKRTFMKTMLKQTPGDHRKESWYPTALPSAVARASAFLSQSDGWR